MRDQLENEQKERRKTLSQDNENQNLRASSANLRASSAATSGAFEALRSSSFNPSSQIALSIPSLQP